MKCETANFIVSSTWCELLQPPPGDGEGTVQPLSTWDIFDNPITNFSEQPSPRAIRSIHEETPLVDLEVADLLKEYQTGIGSWMDLFDHEMNYQLAVPRRAHSSSLIMLALCALTAKQLSMIRRGETWEPVASRYYGESLRLLISVLADPTASREDAFIATILLSSYELLASPGLDHRRHVAGALTLIKTHGFTAKVNGLAKSSFWIFARLDIAMSLIHECPTMLPPADWEVEPDDQEKREDYLANKMLWILAKVIAFTFQSSEEYSQNRNFSTRSDLLTEISSWYEGLPTSSGGIPYGPPSREGFVRQWFAVPASGKNWINYIERVREG